jgi:hypothetical protein
MVCSSRAPRVTNSSGLRKLPRKPAMPDNHECDQKAGGWILGLVATCAATAIASSKVANGPLSASPSFSTVNVRGERPAPDAAKWQTTRVSIPTNSSTHVDIDDPRPAVLCNGDT